MIASSTKRLLAVVLLVAFLFYGHGLKGQSVLPDTAYVDSLFAKSKLYLYKNSDSSIYYLKQVEELSRKINYKKGIANALYGYGLNEKLLYRQFQYFTQSFEIFESIHNAFGIGLNLVRIGTIYDQIGQKEKALEYFKQALAIKMKINDFGGVALSLIKIGHLYQDSGDLTQALKCFEEAWEYRLKEGTHQGIGFAQVNIGEVLFKQNKIEQALAMADSAVYNFSFTNDLQGQMWSMGLKGKLLVKLNKLKEAEKIFEIINAYPKTVHYTNFFLNAKRELISIYANRGDTKKAFELQTEYLIAKDTLVKRDYRSQTQRIVNEYEFRVQEQKAQREKEIQEQQIARRDSLENLSIAIIVLLIFIILFSGRKKLSNKIVNISLLIGLLLLFEFLLILTDSSVEKITQGEPFLKLLANVILALLILPGHQFLEKLTRKKLMQPETI